MAKINFLALGGLDERQKSMNILEIDSKIFILDAGIYEPINSNFGIQCFIPNISYLIENKDKIKGIFLSSAIYQQIGAIPNLIESFPNVKIYGSAVTIKSLKIFFPKNDFSKNVEILEKEKSYIIGDEKIEVVQLNSSIPGTFGYVFKSSDGNIFYFNNYTFDSLVEYNIPLFKEINRFINKKNLFFISDSLNMNVSSSISPKYKISGQIEKYFYHKQRLIVFVYEEDLINIVELLILAKKFKKNIYVYEQKIKDLLEILISEKFIENYKINVIENNNVQDYVNSVIIISGNKTQLFKKIEGIIADNDKDDILFDKEDNIFIATDPIPGNEHIFQDIINDISRFESNLILLKGEEKLSIHPSQFDLKNYLSLLLPKFFIPIRGYYKDFINARKTALSINYHEKNIIIGDNGDIFSFDNKKYLGITRKIKEIGQLIIESVNENKLHSDTIEERMQLGKNGLVTIGFIVQLETKKIISNIDIQMRGVIFIKNQEYLIKNIEDEIKKITNDNFGDSWQQNRVISQINKSTTKILRNKIKKTPIIIINIREYETPKTRE